MKYDIVLFTGAIPVYWQRTLGAYQLASYLRTNGFSVKVVDATLYLTKEEIARTIELYVSDATLAIGVSTTFMSEYVVDLNKPGYALNKDNPGNWYASIIPQELIDNLLEARTKYPNLKLVGGGSRSQSAEELGIFDCVIHGYGEDKMLSYLEQLKADPTNLPTVINKDPVDSHFNIEHLEHRFHDDDHILPGEVLPIEISRGCIFKCKFCSFPLNGKKKNDFIRNAKLITDEMKYNYDRYGTVDYIFTDDTFNDSTAKVETIANEIAKLPFKINFATYLRLDLLYAHQEQIPLMKEMGLASPHFGIESLNQRSATSIGKGMDVEKVKTFLDELYFQHWNAEIPFICSFIIGLPFETRETLQQAFEWAKERPHLNSYFFPLSLAGSHYMSEFQINYAQYGYIMTDRKAGKWKNDHFTSDEAIELHIQYVNELLPISGPGAFRMMNLLNHGYTLEELKKMRWADFQKQTIIDRGLPKLQDYKNIILQR